MAFIFIFLGSSRTSTPTIDKDRRRMCSDNRYDLGRPMVAPTDEIEILTLTTDQTKTSMSLFTIKQKETRGGLSVRVFLHRIDIKLQNENIVIGYNIPNSFRDYRFESRMHPITAPTGKFFASFFQKRRETRVPTNSPQKINKLGLDKRRNF